MRFDGTFILGKTIRMKDMKLRDLENSSCPVAVSTEYILGNSVAFQARAICYDHVIDNDGTTMKATQILVKFKNLDKNTHTVIVTSEVLKLNRYFTADPISSNQVVWHIVYNKVISIWELQFDMEVILVEDGVNEQVMKRLALTLWEDEETTDVVLEGSDGKFAYTGCVSAEPASLATLLPLASRFLMPDLARACAAPLAKSLTAEELVPLLQLDLHHPQPHLLIEMLSRFDSVKIEELKENAAPK